jgi:pimeloyl-ACP methyl ester carboxylesterase
VGSATIEKAEPVARGTQPIGFLKRMFVRTFLFPGLPDLSIPADFCQVSAKVRPVPGSEIAVELWLPRQWNGKMLGTGGSGFSGGLGAGFLTLRRPMGMGYAAVASDVGHESTSSAKFAHDSPQQYVDYAYQGNHVAAEFAKTLIASYYGSPVKRAYFHGCSNGGRDALMLARRFPEDYDGIIAGAPAAGWSKLMTFFAWATQAADGAPKLRDKLKIVHKAVMAKCDALDGVKDQLLENPAQCAFDPGELQCRSGEGSDDCLEVEEVGALRKLYGGPRLRDGTQMYPGLPVGGEGLRKNWEEAIGSGNDGHSLFARESFRWMVYGEPEWEVSRFDIDRDYPKARERMAPIMDSDDPDLSAFTARGGKLMLYHGWNDAMIPAGATLEYHASLRTRLGPAADTQVRLFMVPGMMHCGAGSGPTDFDLLDEMDRWIGSDVAPERIVATQYEPIAVFGPAPDAKIIRTRPLCAWPKVARYNGTGSTDDAVNFRCQ